METSLSELTNLINQFFAEIIAFIPNLIISLLIFIFSIYLSGWISRMLANWMKNRETDTELSLLLETVVKWSLIILGTTMALHQIGFNLTAFLTGLGILGFTLGFAIQDVSKNFVAGLLLLIEQPFDIGDSIEVVGFGGTVLDVDLRATELRTFDGRIVQIPNADIFTSPITNLSRATSRRIALNVGVAYGTPLEHARDIVLRTICTVEGVMTDPEPKVEYNKFGNSSIDFTIYYWFDTNQTDFFSAQDEGIVKIDKAFMDANIEMPVPIQKVLLQQVK